jgi:NitT/TauT family transport system ATP-binding protein
LVSDPFVLLQDVDMVVDRAFTPKQDATHILKSMSMTAGRGQVVALVGASGCGKTTVLRLIAGIWQPTSGTVTINGGDPQGPVGLVTQTPSLFPWLQVLENVMLPLRVAPTFREQFSKRRAEFRDHAIRLLDDVGLAGVAAKYPWELSVGMAQRTSLCRALITEPELLLLDEPFAPLDQITRESMWSMLQTLIAQRPQTTVVLVTHDLREALYLADRVYVMRKRPGAAHAQIDVTLPRPRTQELTYESAFLDYLREGRSLLEEASA